jgi:FAD/FMN-containing dehydrogenase
MLDVTMTEALAVQLRGNLLTPNDEGYDEARSLHNGMIDRKPAMIAQCTGTADVITCVNFARDNNLPLSVKGGGHGVAGKAMCDDGVVIDLSTMRAVIVDPDLKTAQVQAGATLGDLDHETQKFGLAVPSGTDSRTGVAGLTLGGGGGHLARRFGLTVDNLLAADVVTADGSLLRASENDNSDLFWAIRGGGGNFGVVTSFEFCLHEVGPEILTGQAFHLFDDAREVLQFYRDFMADTPKEIGCVCLVLRVPPMPPFPEEHHGKIAVGLVANDSRGEATEENTPLRKLASFGNPILSALMPMQYTALQSNFDAGFPKGARYYWKAHYMPDLPDEAIDTFLAQIQPLPGEFTAIGFEAMDGTIGDVDQSAMAFPHRNARFGLGIFANWADESRDDEAIAWGRRFHEAMEPFSTGGSYVNYLAVDAGDKFREAYGANFERLREIKQRYDPHGLFDAHQRLVAR